MKQIKSLKVGDKVFINGKGDAPKYLKENTLYTVAEIMPPYLDSEELGRRVCLAEDDVGALVFREAYFDRELNEQDNEFIKVSRENKRMLEL